MYATSFERGDLGDLELRPQGPRIHQCFDLEAIGVGLDHVEDVPPEGDVAVAEIGITLPEQETRQLDQAPVAGLAMELHVDGAPTLGEARSFHEVGAHHQLADEGVELSWVHRAVGVDGGDDVAGRGAEALTHGVPLAASLLME